MSTDRTFTATHTRNEIAARRVSALETVSAALARADALEPKLHAFTQLFHEHATAQARAIDARLARGEAVGPLAGVPVALKDNLCLSHGQTTCASKMLENYRSPFDATAALKLSNAGAIIIGKTNLDEFAMGSSTEHSFFGPTSNPWDLSRVPGGSSGGSAAAVAARVTPIALGSDTGGSIRQPAGFCNIVGVKPTYGRVSRYGLVAFASSLDQIGPFATTVADAALTLDVICGHDPCDSTSSDLPATTFFTEVETLVEDATIGVSREAFSSANHPAVTKALHDAINVYTKLGVRIIEIDLPMTDYGIAAYYIVATAEAASNLARFDGVRYGHRAALAPNETLHDLYCRSRAEGFGPEVQRRIMLGTHVLSSGYFDAYYNTALKVRRKIKGDYDAAFRQGCHAVLMPSSPSPAFKRGGHSGDPLAMYLEDVYTVAVNLAGLPAVTFPGGFTEDPEATLPVGVQLVGQPFEESWMLRLARMFERETQFGTRAPKV